MNTYVETIAIDGPAGSGKSTIGLLLAEKLDYLFVDTGLLYRAITAQTLSQGIDVENVERITAVARELNVDVTSPENGPKELLIHGWAIGTHLYTETISKMVPTIAAYGVVRSEVRRIQTEIARYGQIILAGRDIGTVVLPHADLKIFLEASLEVRAARRSVAQNTGSQEQVLKNLRIRDTQDITRAESPLRPAADAIIINTDDMNVDAVLEYVLGQALKK
jgi:cytidylate kinase